MSLNYPHKHLTVGDKAPPFTRPLVCAEFWEDIVSQILESHPVALPSHPMDGDLPATYIWKEIRNRNWSDRRVEPIGISISTPYEHSRFIEEWSLADYRLYSGPHNTVAEEYGVVHDLDGMVGITEPRPAVFLLDQSGTITYSWVAAEWPAFPPYDEIEAACADL